MTEEKLMSYVHREPRARAATIGASHMVSIAAFCAAVAFAAALVLGLI